MGYLFNSTNILLAGSVPGFGFPGFAAFAGGVFFVIAGVCGLFIAQGQINRGKETGRQSRKQSAIAICVGFAGIGYVIVTRLMDLYFG
jgi:hypothetical protein